MADIGQFRSVLGGFNKDDVLEYINSLQEQYAQQLHDLRKQADAEREAYEKALNDANAELARQFDQLQQDRTEQDQLRVEQDRLQKLVSEQYSALRELRSRSSVNSGTQDEVKTLRAQLDEEKKRYNRLAAQLQTPADTGRKSDTLQTRLDLTTEENARLAAENKRYRELVGDVGNFVVDVRAMGQRYIDDANARCSTHLSTISQIIADLTAHLTAAADDLAAAQSNQGDQMRCANEQMDALVREMERTVKNEDTDFEAGITAELSKTPPAGVADNGGNSNASPKDWLSRWLAGNGKNSI